MRLEREIKKAWEPLRVGSWEVRLNVPQDIENWMEDYVNALNRPYVEVVRYV